MCTVASDFGWSALNSKTGTVRPVDKWLQGEQVDSKLSWSDHDISYSSEGFGKRHRSLSFTFCCFPIPWLSASAMTFGDQIVELNGCSRVYRTDLILLVEIIIVLSYNLNRLGFNTIIPMTQLSQFGQIRQIKGSMNDHYPRWFLGIMNLGV